MNEILYSNFRGKYFTLVEFSSVLSKEFGQTKSKIISNSIFDIVDPNHRVIKPRKAEDMNRTTYIISNGTFESYLKKSILRSKIMKTFTGNYQSEYSEFTTISSEDNNLIALKILSIFDYITYEVVGGEQPEIFIRLNDPLKVYGIVKVLSLIRIIMLQ